MPLPSLEQYFYLLTERESLSSSQLGDYEFLSDASGKYLYKHGTTAVVFKARKGNKHYAIRFFLREEPQLFRRYEQISSYLENKQLEWKVGFKFLERGIFFEEQFYPVIIMDWAEGLPLNQFIDEEIFNQSLLFGLQKKLANLSDSLEKNHIGHGDLKFDNILIDRNGADFSFKLVDYDSFYVPDFEGLKNLEPGSPGFQHPRRLASDFSERVDRFSLWVMLTALEALKHDTDLWTNADQFGYNKTKNLVFTLKDLINPAGSKLIQRLQGYKSEALNFYLEKLIRYSQLTRLDDVEKPALYKDAAYMPATKPVAAPVPPVPPVASVPAVPTPAPKPKEEEKKFDIEIKSNPSGKDVALRGVKKGITPLKLSITRNDFAFVEVMDGNEKVKVPINDQIKTYEIGLPKKEPVQQPAIEQDEILEFGADRYTITEGDLATINWRVKGNSKIHISNIGEVAEKTGKKRIVLKDTTRYVLSVGSKQRSLTISVDPKPTPVIEKPAAPAETKVPYKRSYSQIKTKKTRSKKPYVLGGLALLVLIIAFFLFRYFTNPDTQTAGQYNTADLGNAYNTEPAFSTTTVTTFLDGLYASYNQRDLNGILNHYAPAITEYYDEKNMNKDSLRSVINDLFIAPALYRCRPDYKSLKVEPSENHCKVTITVMEQLKSDEASAEEKYNTTIEYVIDPSFKIISEKNIETKSR